MTMLDVAMALAGRSLEPGTAAGITVTMNVMFLRPAPAAGRLTAVGRCVQRARSQSVCEADVLDDTGRLCARATGIFRFVAEPRLP